MRKILGKRTLAQIETCELFSGRMNPELHERLCLLDSTKFAAGQKIFTPTAYRKALGIVVNGGASARMRDGVVLRDFVPGDIFGAASLFDESGEEYVSTVTAKTACEAVFLSKEFLEELFAEFPECALGYIRLLTGKIKFLNKKIAGYTAPSASDALVLYLREHSEDDGVVNLPGGLAALARALGVGRTSLYRSLEELERSGALTRDKKTVKIISLPALGENKR